jgi:hypothetical protein
MSIRNMVGVVALVSCICTSLQGANANSKSLPPGVLKALAGVKGTIVNSFWATIGRVANMTAPSGSLKLVSEGGCRVANHGPIGDSRPIAFLGHACAPFCPLGPTAPETS